MSRAKVWLIGGEDTRYRLPLLEELQTRGFEVGAVGSEPGGAFAEHGVAYWRYSLDRWINPLGDLRSRRELYALFREHRPDVVHAFDTKPAILAPLAARQAGVPGRVRTITGMGYLFSSTSPLALALRPAYRFLQQRAGDASGMTIFQNEDDRRYFLQHGMVRPGREALVAGSGIDIGELTAARPGEAGQAALRRELGLEGQRVVTMVARLVSHKGVREYLKAAAQVRREMPDVTFLLVGPASSEGRQAVSLEEIRRYTADVRYLGPRRDVPALLSVTDLFVLPTYYREGVPRVLLEAGALGLPLVACDVPGCRDVVRHEWNGLLVPPRDAPRLAAAIRRLLAAAEERLRMGERSRAHVGEHFNLDLVADAYAAIYERVLADRG